MSFSAAAHDTFKRGQNVGVGRAEFRWFFAQHRVHALDRCVPPKRPRAAEHFVKHTAESKNVSAMVGRFAAHLLGRHVRWRAQQHAGLGGVDDRVDVAADG